MPLNKNVIYIKKTGAASRVARGITTLVAAKCKGNKRRTIEGGKAISAPEKIGTAERENGRTNLLVATTTTRGVDSTAVARVGIDTMGKATTTEDLKIPGWGTGIKGTAKVQVDRTTTPGENNPRATAAPGTTAGASRATQSWIVQNARGDHAHAGSAWVNCTFGINVRTGMAASVRLGRG